MSEKKTLDARTNIEDKRIGDGKGSKTKISHFGGNCRRGRQILLTIVADLPTSFGENNGLCLLVNEM
ncbi:hypothetical protein KFK09_019439 [Dendrobium nobile]|uniref:Uncharacterized protein n=1 Tax=Dendrobium nobile TaxID=94219 RepID=A0A8T3AR25_DENNO|nr:hypothetical protein KFK09_019439 [Dendrobium nobile]